MSHRYYFTIRTYSNYFYYKICKYDRDKNNEGDCTVREFLAFCYNLHFEYLYAKNPFSNDFIISDQVGQLAVER